MKSEDFERTMDTFTKLMLTQEHEGFPETEFKAFLHITDVWMRESYRNGAMGSSVPHVIAKLRSANNPLCDALANAMQWSYRKGIESRG